MTHGQLITALRQRREDHGWSMRELARRVGLTGHATVAAWETGATVPNAIYLLEWITALGGEPAIRWRKSVS